MGITTIKYDAEPVSVGDELALCNLIKLGGLYYRSLASVENEHRRAIRELDLSDPVITALQVDFPKEGTKEYIERKAALRARRKELAQDETFQALAAELRTKAQVAKKQARGNSGLAPKAWGTYQFVEDAHDTSRSTTKWPSDLKVFSPLDEGVIAVHHQGKERLSTKALFDSSWNFAQIDPRPYGLGRRFPAGYCEEAGGRWMPGHAFRSTGEGDFGRSGQRGAQRYNELRIRVDSVGRSPVWARLHVLATTRELPEGTISWVRVHRHRVGIRYQWSVQIVIDLGEVFPRVPPTAEMVAVDLRCGRRIDGGRLLAYAVGSDNEHHTLVIPDHCVVKGKSYGVVSDEDKPSQLASIRGTALNELIAVLRSYRDTLEDECWLKGELSHIHAWKSWNRVGACFSRWRRQRLPGDTAMFSLVEKSLRQDRHLLMWEVSSRMKRENRIRGAVDAWCVALVKRYGVIAIEDMKLLDMVQPDDKDDRLARIVAQRIAVFAPGRLRERLKRAAQAHCRKYVVIDSFNNTRTCNRCFSLCMRRDDGVVHCRECGHVALEWITAANNILRRASGEVNSEGSPSQDAKKTRARHTRKRVKLDPSQSQP